MVIKITYGKKMKTSFPDIEILGESKNTLDYSLGGMIHRVTKKWWNTEYREPKCTWIKYDHRTMCPKEHDVGNPYWRIPENRMETLKYCPYCGKEIEVEE